jgi:hypothetical protein
MLFVPDKRSFVGMKAIVVDDIFAYRAIKKASGQPVFCNYSCTKSVERACIGGVMGFEML